MGLSPSKPPSLTENFPHVPAISEAKIWFVFWKWRGHGGSFCCLGGADLLQGAASHPIGGRRAFGGYAVYKCRDSACRRPFGVRLRGNDWFSRLPLHHCAAPLRMTQRIDFCMGDTMLIHQSNIATNRLHLTERHILRVILSGAAQISKIKR